MLDEAPHQRGEHREAVVHCACEEHVREGEEAALLLQGWSTEGAVVAEKKLVHAGHHRRECRREVLQLWGVCECSAQGGDAQTAQACV